MTKPLRQRDWFQTCYAHIAGVISGCVIQGRVVPHAASEVERQLEKAYNQGRRDGRKELREAAIRKRQSYMRRFVE